MRVRIHRDIPDERQRVVDLLRAHGGGPMTLAKIGDHLGENPTLIGFIARKSKKYFTMNDAGLTLFPELMRTA
jgi:hypothetical protein